jgi:hypothetical protein
MKKLSEQREFQRKYKAWRKRRNKDDTDLPAAEAAAMMEDGRYDELYIELPEICNGFGLSEEQLKEEIMSCRLQVVGTPTVFDPERTMTRGYKNVAVRIDHLIEWMVKTKRAPIHGAPSTD